MDSENQFSPNSLGEIWKTLIFFVPGFAVTSGCLYLSAYWGAFDINIFQYVNIADVVGISIIPLIFLLIMTLPAILIGTLQGQKAGLRAMQNSGRSKTFLIIDCILKFFKWPWYILSPVLLALLGASDWYLKWIGIGLILIVYVAIFLPGSNLNFFPGVARKFQFAGVFFVLTMIIFSYALGDVSGKAIAIGVKYLYVVESDIPELTEKNSEQAKSVRFVGHVAEYDFFYSPEKKTVIVTKNRDEHFLMLGRHFDADSDFVLRNLRSLNRQLAKIIPITSTDDR